MEITSWAVWSLIHGMGFGGLYLLACSGAIVELWSVLELRWRKRNVRMNRVSIAAVVLLMVGLLLMFPPLADAL